MTDDGRNGRWTTTDDRPPTDGRLTPRGPSAGSCRRRTPPPARRCGGPRLGRVLGRGSRRAPPRAVKQRSSQRHGAGRPTSGQALPERAAEAGPAMLHRRWPTSGRMPAKPGPKPGHARATIGRPSGHLWPPLEASRWSGERWPVADGRPLLPKLGPDLTNLGRVWPYVGRFGPHLDQTRRTWCTERRSGSSSKSLGLGGNRWFRGRAPLRGHKIQLRCDKKCAGGTDSRRSPSRLCLCCAPPLSDVPSRCSAPLPGPL